MTWLLTPLVIAAAFMSYVVLAQTPTAGQEIAPWIAALSNLGLAGIAVWLIVIRGPIEAKERRDDANAARREYFDQLTRDRAEAASARKEALGEVKTHFDSIRALVEELHEVTRDTHTIAKDVQNTAHEMKHVTANLYQSQITRAAIEEQRARAQAPRDHEQ